MRGLGIGPGDRVATFMWNNQEHLEAYLAVPAMGAVVHPLNIRLFPEQVTYVANHAEDQVVIVDRSLLPGFAKLLPDLKTVRHVIVNSSVGSSVGGGPTLPDGGVAVHDYTRLLSEQPDSYDWPDVDENPAAAYVLHLRHHRRTRRVSSTATARSTSTRSASACPTCSASVPPTGSW